MTPNEKGFTLIETVVGLMLLAIIAAGVIPLGVLAITTSENQGHLSSRAAEYAQDKLEQLMALSYGDTTSDTRVFPSPEIGGTGLTIGGSSDPASPVNLYVDYLTMEGELQAAAVGGAAPTDWYYQRVWSVAAVAGRTDLKQITVTAIVRSSSGRWALRPRATVTALKTSPF